jgi:predicted secreted Zn-dependent protease
MVLSCGLVPLVQKAQTTTVIPVKETAKPANLPQLSQTSVKNQTPTRVPSPTITRVPSKTSSPTTTAVPTATPLGALEIPNTIIKYYDVVGSTEDELIDQMNKLGPADDSGYRGDGLADTNLTWDWPGKGTSSCQVDKAVVKNTNTVTLPRWLPPANASQKLKDEWVKFMHALVLHEQGHVERYDADLKAVQDAARNATCDTAVDAMKDAVKNVVVKHRDEYDAETEHGIKQGALFPPD